jgi:ABC-type Mn2+/Zn2+ transport system ATPase subunit
MTEILSVSGLEFGFKEPLFRRVNFSLRPGEMMAVLGPNGSGKSTLLKCLTGEIRDYQGRIEISAPLSYLAQKSAIDLDFPISVEELIQTGLLAKLRPWQRLGPQERRDVEWAIEVVGLQAHRNSPIGILSGGQLQRALFGRALVQKAKLMILDEPFAGVDLPTEEFLLKCLQDYCTQQKGSVLFVHHNFFSLPKSVHRVLVLGRTQVHLGSPTELLSPERLRFLFSPPFEGSTRS